MQALKKWNKVIGKKENKRYECGQLTGWGHAALLRAIAGSVTSGASWKQSDNNLVKSEDTQSTGDANGGYLFYFKCVIQ
jgi:hypothetical protein